MSDHHFSYPRVVPLGGATISGHAAQTPAPIGMRPVALPAQADARHAAPSAFATSVNLVASVSPASFNLATPATWSP